MERMKTYISTYAGLHFTPHNIYTISSHNVLFMHGVWRLVFNVLFLAHVSKFLQQSLNLFLAQNPLLELWSILVFNSIPYHTHQTKQNSVYRLSKMTVQVLLHLKSKQIKRLVWQTIYVTTLQSQQQGTLWQHTVMQLQNNEWDM
jgi:hypothetical protein